MSAWVFTLWIIVPAAWAETCALIATKAERWYRAMRLGRAMSESVKPSKRRILLVDDHPLVREGLAESINRESDLMVCAEADDRHEAIEAIQKTKPDLVIADLALKTSSGMELIKDIHSRWPRLPVLVVSMHDEALYAERALRAGARG